MNERKPEQSFSTNTMMWKLTKKDLVRKAVEIFLHIKEYCRRDKAGVYKMSYKMQKHITYI